MAKAPTGTAVVETAGQEAGSTAPQASPKVEAAAARREIPGNLPYLTASGTLKRILDRVVELAKPDKFNYDFLENVVKITGGSARACIPILKKMEFLNSDNSPTELYSRFRTESGRPQAAYAGLKNAFPEIFKRSDYAYSVEEAKLRDIILEITGLKANDTVAQAIKGTFNVIKSYISGGFNPSADGAEPAQVEMQPTSEASGSGLSTGDRQIGIAYNINIVLPETSDLSVLNAIFRSLRENLLK
jgi:hypothetical protein